MSLVNIRDKFIVRAGTGGGISAPSNVTITNKSTSGFTVSWDAVAGALGYKLDVSTDSGFGSFVTGYNAKDVAGTSQAVTGLTQNTTYYVRVRTVAASSNSGSVFDSTNSVVVSETTFSSLGQGLQAFYKLDDTADASGNGNTLTNNGGVTFSSGKIGNAAVFDGSNNLSLASLPNANCSETTVTFWFKDTSGAQERFLVSGGLSDSQFYIARASGDVKANFTNSGEKYCGGFGANDGNWHFFAARFTSTELKLQLDGTTSTYSGSYNSIQSSNSFRLGSNWDGTYIRLIGAMDAVGIWNRALTDSEIAELYNAGAGKELSGLLNGLQAFYKLDDLTDVSGNNYSLGNIGNSNATFVSGKIGNAASFDGNVVLKPSIATSSDAVTFSLWYNSNSETNFGTWATMLDTTSSGFNFGPRLEMANGTGDGFLGLYANGVYTSGIDIKDNNWHHIVATLASNGDIKLYHNNSVVISDNVGNHTVDFSTLCLGNDTASNPGSELNGLLDAVGVWNRVLTESEISELYNAGAGKELSGLLNGLQAFYKLDDTADASGNGNTLTDNGGVTFSSGKIGNAAVFDGSTWLNRIQSSTFDIIEDFTISAFIKLNQLGSYYILQGVGETESAGEWSIMCAHQEYGWIGLEDGIVFATHYGTEPVQYAPWTPTTDTWYHIAIKRASGSLMFYVDGQVVGTSSDSASRTSSGLSIGKSDGNGNGAFFGQIDAVGIWNRALSDSEIAELYNAGAGLE